VTRIALYILVPALIMGVGAWLWLAREAPMPPPTPAAVATLPALVQAPSPAAIDQSLVPSFDVVRVSPDGRTVLAGRATPGDTVTVTSGEDPVGEAKADSRGEWVLLPAQPLAPGSRELGLSARQGAGPAREGEATVVVVVPERPEAGGAVAALLSKDGQGDTRLLQAPTPQGDVSTARGLTIEAVDFDAKGVIRPAGKASPGAEIRLYLDNDPIGTARADERGQWSLPPGNPVGPGNHSLRADQIGADGQVAARIEAPFNRTAPSLASAKPGSLVVQPGASLWRIARRTYGAGNRFTIIYQANRDLIRDPNKIYPGQTLLTPAPRR